MAEPRDEVAKKLCCAAAQAALAGRSDASFDRLCTALAELAAAAVPESRAASKAGTLCLLSKAGFAAVARWYDGDLLGVFRALQQHMGWSAQQAAAALLQGIGLDLHDEPDAVQAGYTACPLPLARSLLSTSVQRVEEVARLLRCGRL